MYSYFRCKDVCPYDMCVQSWQSPEEGMGVESPMAVSCSVGVGNEHESSGRSIDALNH